MRQLLAFIAALAAIAPASAQYMELAPIPESAELGCRSQTLLPIPTDVTSCQSWCNENRPDLPIVSWKLLGLRYCCACSSVGYTGEYCHSEIRCVAGFGMCCTDSPGSKATVSLATALVAVAAFLLQSDAA
jgi:hypothetical protein